MPKIAHIMRPKSCSLLSHILRVIPVELSASMSAAIMWRAIIGGVFAALLIPDHH
jgi:hypothetical protein